MSLNKISSPRQDWLVEVARYFLYENKRIHKLTKGSNCSDLLLSQEWLWMWGKFTERLHVRIGWVKLQDTSSTNKRIHQLTKGSNCSDLLLSQEWLWMWGKFTERLHVRIGWVKLHDTSSTNKRIHQLTKGSNCSDLLLSQEWLWMWGKFTERQTEWAFSLFGGTEQWARQTETDQPHTADSFSFFLSKTERKPTGQTKSYDHVCLVSETLIVLTTYGSIVSSCLVTNDIDTTST